MELIETPVFTRQVQGQISDEDYRELQLRLMLRPAVGAVIPGSGGLRKLRWRLPGRGKRGGSRIIYFWKSSASQIFPLYLYAKNERSNLSLKELRVLRNLVTDD